MGLDLGSVLQLCGPAQGNELAGLSLLSNMWVWLQGDSPAPEQAGPALGVVPEDVSGGLGTSDCGTG